MMKKIVMISLVLMMAVLAGGCATAIPKLYVPESELPKTKFVIVAATTYKEFSFDKEKKEFTFSNLTNDEYGKIFKETFVKELEKRGFIVFPSSVVTNDDFLTIEVSFAEKPPLVLFTNGLLVQTTIVKDKKKEIWRLDSMLFTDPPIIPSTWLVRVKFAPALAEKITEVFKK
jgi:hypothetical protein